MEDRLMKKITIMVGVQPLGWWGQAKAWTPTATAARVVCVATAMLFGWSADVAFGKPALGKTWPTSQQVSMNQIEHSAFDGLLKKYVDSDGYVKYRAWHRSSSDRRALRNYLAQLGRASTKISATQNARLAFWINAYNAVTLEGIMQVYPTDSIRNHTAKVFGYNIWKELPLRVGSGQYSLEQMEHQILRKMREPRIHFAIVCASAGCPRLRNEAYTGKRVQAQLAANTTDFFSRRQNFRVSGKTMSVSAIVDWFSDDFGRSQAARFGYLKQYLPKSAQSLATRPGTTVIYLDYDWSLNDQSRRRRAASR